MAPQQQERLRALTAEEQAALARVQQATSGRHDEVQRATALLAVAAGARCAAAARGAGYAGGSTVQALVKRFNARGLAAVSIAPGRGPQVTDDAATRAQVAARPRARSCWRRPSAVGSPLFRPAARARRGWR